MPTYQSPGVYRQEVFLKTKAALPTGVPGFIGFADERSDSARTSGAGLDGLPDGLQFPDALPGDLRNTIAYNGAAKRLTCAGAMTGSGYRELLKLSVDAAYRTAVKNLYQLSQTMLQTAVELRRKEEFPLRFTSLPPEASFLADAVNGFFDNGGVYCYVVHADASQDPENALVAALEALSPLSDLDLVAVPDAMTLALPIGGIDREAVAYVQQKTLDHCRKQGNRIALLDALPGGSADDVLGVQCPGLKSDPKGAMSGALYFPWITTSPTRLVPPCGHVAGIYARTDGKAGTHKAPANEELLGVIDLETPVDNGIQDRLNPEGVNCLRAFPGRGIRVWGARTLSRDPAWRYVNIRRLALTLGRWIDANMTWAAFEPNTPRLWLRIQRELSGQLSRLWQAGALKGDRQDQAFYIKCDAETNPADEREAGKVVTEIGLAPAVPAEFIVVRIIHRAGTTELD